MLLQRMVVVSFIPVLCGAVVMCSSMLEVADVVPNLHRYFAHKVPLSVIGRIALLYGPKCVAVSIPFALLFAVLYVLGGIHVSNEVIGVLSAGVSLRRLTLPLLLIGIGCSFALFVFEDSVVVRTMHMKNRLYHTALDILGARDNAMVAAVSSDRRSIYYADFYDDEAARIEGVTVLALDGAGGLRERLEAERGYRDGGRWVFEDVRRFVWRDGVFAERRMETYEDDRSTAPSHEAFRYHHRDVDDLPYAAAMELAETMRAAGREYRFVLTDAYGKIARSLSPLVLTGIAIGLGGMIRRNVFLTSLVAAAALTIAFSVVSTTAAVLAKHGYLPPAVGAFAGSVLFACTGVVLYSMART